MAQKPAVRTRTIRQTVTIGVSPRGVYEALMDSRKHARFTGEPASISPRAGGRFKTFGGWAWGVTTALVPNRKIVQAWECEDPCWPRGHRSTATFTLSRTPRGTRLEFTQTGVPADCYESISQGWRDFYWKPLKAMPKAEPAG